MHSGGHRMKSSVFQLQQTLVLGVGCHRRHPLDYLLLGVAFFPLRGPHVRRTAHNSTLSAAGSLPLAPRVLRSPADGFFPERAEYQVLEGTLRAPAAFVTGARHGKI